MSIMDLTLTGFILHKLANRDRKRRNLDPTVRTVVPVALRLVLHIVGFSCLTVAAFSLNFAAGMITAGMSCFIFSWLMNGNSQRGDDGRFDQ